MKIHDISIRLAGAALGAVLVATGCQERHEFHDTGTACLHPVAPPDENLFLLDKSPRDYQAGDDLDVTVFLTCLSSTCTVPGSASASCTVEQTGNALRVSARGSFLDTGDDACSADCRPLVARCATAPLGAATFTIEYAGQSGTLVVPSSVPPACVQWDPQL